MKRTLISSYVLLLISALIPTTVAGQAIRTVTVFPSGAQITRTATVTAEPGTGTLVF